MGSFFCYRYPSSVFLGFSLTLLSHSHFPAAARTGGVGSVNPAFARMIVAHVISARTSPNSVALTLNGRSVVGASAYALPWWVLWLRCERPRLLLCSSFCVQTAQDVTQ
ncbi:hypothetical protein GDO86_014703 [Hymenochirus boettgeri]|uniref:Uncharacterized protein n=1 Tax=Hymenochirus boettgeri TaxID=247094 RepID=A0A8T2JPW4_9PIPI|nr:hypothetical protein GDO86_014703 [Hymenochirus boettgeri]